MDGIGQILNIARHRFAIAIRQEGGNASFVHPWNSIDMQPGLAFACWRIFVAPSAQFQSPRMVARSEYENVAFSNSHAMGFLDLLEFFPRHSFPWLKPFDAAITRRVEQNTPPNQASRVCGDGTPFGAKRCKC